MSELSFSIRPVRPWDVFTLTRMAYANMTDVDREFTRFARNPLLRILGYFFLPFYMLASGRGFKAVGEGQILGCAYLHLRRFSGMVFNVNVNRPHRRQGVGRALMAHVEAKVREEGRPWIGLQVDGDNEPAQSLYEGLGYRSYNSQFLRSNDRSLLQGALLPGVEVQQLRRRAGRRLWNRYADLERRKGDAWAARVVEHDYDEGPPLGGAFLRCRFGAEEAGCAWIGGDSSRPALALLFRPDFWDRRTPTLALLRALLARRTNRPQAIDVHFGSSSHFQAAHAILREFGFTPQREPRFLMLKRLEGQTSSRRYHSQNRVTPSFTDTCGS